MPWKMTFPAVLVWRHTLKEHFERAQNLLVSIATELAAGPAFESRARSIMREHAANYGPTPSMQGSTLVADSVDGTSNQKWHPSIDLINTAPSPVILSKTESYRLFDVFTSLMGINQHYLDPRKFMDSLDLLYRNDSTRSAQMETMWYTQYLLVMAMGMLIGSPSEEGSDNPPGNAFFSQAMRRLPPTYELGSHGVIAVEVLCLASLYLQWCDRKHDAYLYVRA